VDDGYKCVARVLASDPIQGKDYVFQNRKRRHDLTKRMTESYQQDEVE
jgi:hypothetical protein